MGRMPLTAKKDLQKISAAPVKEFFVNMLTRDIELTDAILDLLDNCVDGIHRKLKGRFPKSMPYADCMAEITFDKDHFQIKDNCGGIPYTAFAYAFRMGRDRENNTDKGLKTVGAYGIGMKRAAFKMGKSIKITTKNDDGQFDIAFPDNWLENDDWQLDLSYSDNNALMTSNGTIIAVTNLHADISNKYGITHDAFTEELITVVAKRYCIIIDKGFSVKINGKIVKPEPIIFAWDSGENSIKPYVYKTTFDGVDVFLTVGFRQKLLSEDEEERQREKSTYSSDYAGWTIICNDRAVLYCDKTHLTGWGEQRAPQYHTQFIAISGVVEFVADDPSKLPTTTTKHGIDLSSRLYSIVKEKMIGGLLLFTGYTNKWKKDTAMANSHIDKAKRLTFQQVKAEVLRDKSILRKLPSKSSSSKLVEYQMKPELPQPVRVSTESAISFRKSNAEIKLVAEYLGLPFEPTLVGRTCFEQILSEANNE